MNTYKSVTKFHVFYIIFRHFDPKIMRNMKFQALDL